MPAYGTLAVMETLANATSLGDDSGVIRCLPRTLAMTATWANATSLGNDSGVIVRIWSLRRQRYRDPTIATTPNTRIAAPEIRFTQVRAAMVTFDRSTATTAVRMIHH